MDYDVIIVPTYMQAEAWRKREAIERPGGLFGLTVATFETWIADLWELNGDGRQLVDSNVREALMRKTARMSAQNGGSQARGLASLATRCVRRAAGVKVFEQAADLVRRGCAVSGLSAQENSFLSLIARYEDSLQALGLIEVGEAAALLAQSSEKVFRRPLRVLVTGSGGLTWIQNQFFSQCSSLQATVLSAEGAGGIEKAPPGVQVRFAFPSGKLAQPGLVADIISSMGEMDGVVITGSQPLDLFERLEERLLDMGCSIRLQAVKPFSQTDFGKAFFACYQASREEVSNQAFLSDAVGSFFGGFSRSDALQVDKELRINRIERKEEAFARLREQSESFSQLEQMVRGDNVDECIDAFERRVQASAHGSASWRAEQLAALRKLRSVFEAARFVGVDIDACADMLSRASVALAVQSGGSGLHVLVTSTQLAAALPAGKFDVVVATDLTSEDYPVAEREDALATLMDALGLAPEESALEKARREFTALLKLPKRVAVLSRPLGDANADETYPAVVLEEFVDAYRSDPSDASEVDNAYRLPPLLQDDMVERGEELLFANAHAIERDKAQLTVGEIARPRIDDLNSQTVLQIPPRRRDSSGDYVEGLCVSPSQIEAYLECPYSWFANRRLRIETLDEGFGPLERGSFAHEALETFYRRFQGAGHAKVTEDTLSEARDLMRRITQELAKRQYEMEPGSGRLVATTEIERREVSSLCEQLVNYLDFEAKLLPSFHPAYFEYEIDVDHAVEYAGCRLVGKVDRIDIDDSGHAVIVDYKGSLNAEHEIEGKVEGRCGKVQTRIYAQAVKRVLGLDVVAALYVSYGRTPTVSGAFDPRFVEAAHLPGARIDKCSCGVLEEMPQALEGESENFSLASLTFAAMLNETEAIVDRAMRSMEQGDIAPRPANPSVCAYCPVLACTNRGA